MSTLPWHKPTTRILISFEENFGKKGRPKKPSLLEQQQICSTPAYIHFRVSKLYHTAAANHMGGQAQHNCTISAAQCRVM